MNFSSSELAARAERIVQRERSRLPPPLRSLADKLPVGYHDWPTPEILGEEFEDDILGLFIGDAYHVEPGLSSNAPAQILLFLENILDAAEGDIAVFDEEVRLTYLHELGHYLGWDEEDLEARGLE